METPSNTAPYELNTMFDTQATPKNEGHTDRQNTKISQNFCFIINFDIYFNCDFTSNFLWTLCRTYVAFSTFCKKIISKN